MSNKPTLTRAVAEQTIAAVNAANGNIAQAAEALGISRGTLNPRLKRAFQLYKLKPSERSERALAYDEYAMKNNFQFQEPIQALWVTHPDYGITASWPIYLQKRGSTFR